MALQANPESPVDVAEKLLSNPEGADPRTIATLISVLDDLQNKALDTLETGIARRGERSLSFDQALQNFARTGPVIRYGQLVGALRQLYQVKA